MVALAEEVPPRPLNVYLSCSERARALICCRSCGSRAGTEALKDAKGATVPSGTFASSEEAGSCRRLYAVEPCGELRIEPCKECTRSEECRCRKERRSDRLIPPCGAAAFACPPPRAWGLPRSRWGLLRCLSGSPSTGRTPRQRHSPYPLNL